MNWLNKTERGYIYDKRIFWAVFSVVVILILYIFYQHNFDVTPNIYFKCTQSICENPLYMADCRQQLSILFFIPLYTTDDCKEEPGYEWLKEKYLAQGEYGEPPPSDFLYKGIRMLVLLIILLGLILNHLLHNKGKKFDIEIRVSDKVRINRETIKRWLKSERDKDNQQNR